MTFGKGTGSESPQKIPVAGAMVNVAKDMASGKFQENVKKMTQPKMPAVGTEERKAEYDRRNWAYDDTIPGYGAKTDPTKADEKPPAEEQVPDQSQKETDHGSYADGNNMYQDSMKPTSTLENIQQKEQQGPSQEVERPEYQQRRQQARLDRRRARGAGTSDTYDIRTDKKEARMKYGRGSKEFKKYKKELKDARRSRRQERRDNR